MQTDTAGVAVRPPLLFAASILTGVALGRLVPLPALPGALAYAGMGLAALAVLTFALAVRAMRRAGTPVRTSRPTALLVRRGPFRFSRNPIYVSMALFHGGLGLWTGNVWLLVLLLPVLAVIARGVVAREERYLAARLGEEYVRYCAEVRRWL